MRLSVSSARPFSFDPAPEISLERVTAEQFEAMIDAGIFHEDATPELAAATYGSTTTIARDSTVTFQLFDGQTLAVPAADLLP